MARIIPVAALLLALASLVSAAPSSAEAFDWSGAVRCDPIPEMMPRSGIRDERTRWPNRTVVYRIDNSFNEQERRTILQGIQEITSKTCLRFKVRTNERDFVNVGSDRQGCHAAAGRTGGSQVLNLQKPGCVQKGIAAHEFLHSVGIHHEHQRPDRDDFVRIQLENVERQFRFAFDKMNDRDVSTFRIPYDFKSIMHYDNRAASSNGQDTIVVKSGPKVKMGQIDGLTRSDATKVNRMYGCPDPS